MTEATEIAKLPPKETALEVYSKPSGLEPWLEKIRAEVSGHVPDLKTKKGRDAIASLAFKVRKVKTALDGMGKQLVDDLKDVPKRIDAERKRMRDTLDALADDVRRPLTEWEQAEEDRVQRHKDAVEGIASLVVNCNESAESLRAALAAVEAIAIGPEWEEFEAEAARAKDKALSGLRDRLVAREKYEAEQAELARLRAVEAAREQKEREERIAREAAERAQREAEARAQAERDAAARREAEALAAAETARLNAQLAEQRRIAAEQQAELDRQAAAVREREAAAQAEQRARQAAEQAAAAERQRIADEQAAAAAEAASREEDMAHKATINRAALDAFVHGGMPEDCAKQAVTLIAKGLIPNIRITY
ncbi:MAG: hypothetical protein J0I68_17735 [Achromobacter sp.]|uniref:Uncharacterized protein n=2 Tax=Achromobacter TaxID=222 RepID=A0A6J4ZHT6_9BURK|nr:MULTISPECIES: hypothetical protein [Achromobacter]MBN9640389.1 hypothetical protein [Achromobacter sp.]CAB3627842.1 hypothetical protein LMG26845_00500 [Achromobacter insuavis]CUJ60910.1 Uncharacterised protein [Achromobacter sp. 2789STDY5608628]